MYPNLTSQLESLFLLAGLSLLAKKKKKDDGLNSSLVHVGLQCRKLWSWASGRGDPCWGLIAPKLKNLTGEGTWQEYVGDMLIPSTFVAAFT